ncbi:MAG: stage II sporulation protein R [Wujia sp.]
MTAKIIRGVVLGILLGVCGGIVITNAMHAIKGQTQTVFAPQESEDFTEYEDAVTNLEDVVVRFHVRANSNATKDLALKYQVRDAILEAFAGDLQNVESSQEAIYFLTQHIDEIRNLAREVVYEAGYDYDVRAYITREDFPIREYGELVIPAGSYQALRIDIGAARGENFWCMLYPMLCYTADSAAVVSEEDGKKLSHIVSEEEYEKLFVKRDTKKDTVKIRCKLWDLLVDGKL